MLLFERTIPQSVGVTSPFVPRWVGCMRPVGRLERGYRAGTRTSLAGASGWYFAIGNAMQLGVCPAATDDGPVAACTTEAFPLPGRGGTPVSAVALRPRGGGVCHLRVLSSMRGTGRSQVVLATRERNVRRDEFSNIHSATTVPPTSLECSWSARAAARLGLVPRARRTCKVSARAAAAGGDVCAAAAAAPRDRVSRAPPLPRCRRP